MGSKVKSNKKNQEKNDQNQKDDPDQEHINEKIINNKVNINGLVHDSSYGGGNNSNGDGSCHSASNEENDDSSDILDDDEVIFPSINSNSLNVVAAIDTKKVEKGTGNSNSTTSTTVNNEGNGDSSDILDDEEVHFPAPSPLSSTSHTESAVDGSNQRTPRTALYNNLNLSTSGKPLTLSSIKKSNLKKYSKYESFSGVSDLFFTPPTPKRSHDDEGGATPRKRIRIVVSNNQEFTLDENDQCNDDNDDDIKISKFSLNMSESDASDSFESSNCDNGNEVDEDDQIPEAVCNLHWAEKHGEKMMWVSRQNQALDFTFINEDIVRAMRAPMTKKLSVEIDMHFINSETITELLGCKNRINEVGAWNYEKECIKRRQIKTMKNFNEFKYGANATNLQQLDELLDFELTLPSNFFKNCDTQVDDEQQQFYFADIWTVSKGFREYILSKSLEHTKKGLMYKGFALQDYKGRRDTSGSVENFLNPGILFSSINTITPPIAEINDNDLNDGSKKSLPIEFVEHFNNLNSYTNKDIDICDILVNDDYVKTILTKTEGRGVHLMIADNEEYFNVHETVREVRFGRKFFSQSIIAILAVREGGNFIVKIFDGITSFTVGVIFLLYRCFSSVTIHKPKCSPGQCSERFLICRGKVHCEETDDILQFLLTIHGVVMHNEEIRRIFRKKVPTHLPSRRRLDISKFEVRQLLPLKVIIGYADFFEFLRLTNIRLTNQLCNEINEICQSFEPSTVSDKMECSQKPVVTRLDEMKAKISTETATNSEFQSLMLTKFNIKLSNDTLILKALNKTNLQEVSDRKKDWAIFPIPMQDCNRKCVFPCQDLSLILSLGDKELLYWDRKVFKWKRVEINGIHLTKGTLVLGNFAEIFPIGNKGKISLEFHISDAVGLNGEFIGDVDFVQRRKILSSYITVINRTIDLKKSRKLVLRSPIKVPHEQQMLLSEWIASSVRVESNIGFYPGSMRVMNEINEQNMVIPIDGFCFWDTSGSFMESLNNSFQWNWNNDLGDTTTVLVEDFQKIIMG